jgi:hypothetical protein
LDEPKGSAIETRVIEKFASPAVSCCMYNQEHTEKCDKLSVDELTYKRGEVPTLCKFVVVSVPTMVRSGLTAALRPVSVVSLIKR